MFLEPRLATIFCVAVAALVAPVAFEGRAHVPQHPAEPSLLTSIERYTSWDRATRTPYRVSPKINALCADARSVQASPHDGAYIDVYVNEIGRAAMHTKGDTVFPEGTVIVKAKRHDERDVEPTLLTVMVKRTKGYNPEVGDWEFAVVDGKVTTVREQGRLRSCMGCHTTVAGTDFVFRTYLAESR
jgi:hypothetical protein